MSIKIIPNLLSIFRVISAPFLLILAWNDHHNLFIGLLIAALLSDALDGFLARKLNATSDLGAKLDSLGDMAIYLTVPLCAWWLWPQIVKDEALFIFILIAAYILPILTSLLKFKQIPSYHTLGAKIAAVIISIAVLTLFIFESALIFRIAVILQVIVACEEIIITIKLPVMQSDIKSIWHLHKQKNQNRT